MIAIPRRLLWQLSIGGAGVVALAGVAWLAAHAESAPGGADSTVPPTTAAPPGAVAPGTSPPPPPSDGETAPAPTQTPKTTVRIVFKVIPPNKATVSWGKKRLGIIKPRAPLVIERPRDSGPLDVIVRSDGYVPVHTRAYTFTNSTVAVKMTPIDKKNTIYGYREAPPPDADAGVLPGSGGPDGGVAPAPPSPLSPGVTFP